MQNEEWHSTSYEQLAVNLKVLKMYCSDCAFLYAVMAQRKAELMQLGILEKLAGLQADIQKTLDSIDWEPPISLATLSRVGKTGEVCQHVLHQNCRYIEENAASQERFQLLPWHNLQHPNLHSRPWSLPSLCSSTTPYFLYFDFSCVLVQSWRLLSLCTVLEIWKDEHIGVQHNLSCTAASRFSAEYKSLSLIDLPSQGSTVLSVSMRSASFILSFWWGSLAHVSIRIICSLPVMVQFWVECGFALQVF